MGGLWVQIHFFPFIFLSLEVEDESMDGVGVGEVGEGLHHMLFYSVSFSRSCSRRVRICIPVLSDEARYIHKFVHILF